jgi:hypothetical protein
MAINVNRKQPKESAINRMLPLAGMAAGAAIGGPAGAGIGGSVGSAIQGMNQPKINEPVQVAQDPNAIQRRLQSAQEDKLEVLRAGAMALTDPSVPPEVRQEAAKPILTAFQLERNMRNNQGVG